MIFRQPIPNLCRIAVDWCGAVGVLIFTSSNPTEILVWLASVPLLACFQHGILAGLHEATHFHLLSRNRKWNDILGNILCAQPFGISLAGYRANHLEHHRFLNTALDPDSRRTSSKEWEFPMSARSFLRISLRDLAGLNWRDLYLFKKEMARRGKQQGHGVVPLFPAIWILFGLLTPFFSIFLFLFVASTLWILSQYTVLNWFLRIRLIGEHYAPGEMVTRNICPGRLESFLFAPHGIGWHKAHHEDPSIPAFLLLPNERGIAAGYFGKGGIIWSLLKAGEESI